MSRIEQDRQVLFCVDSLEEQCIDFWIGNDICNAVNNRELCYYDGGDCLAGEIDEPKFKWLDMFNYNITSVLNLPLILCYIYL